MKTFKLVFLIIVLTSTTWLMILGAKANSTTPIDTVSVEAPAKSTIATEAVILYE